MHAQRKNNWLVEELFRLQTKLINPNVTGSAWEDAKFAQDLVINELEKRSAPLGQGSITLRHWASFS